MASLGPSLAHQLDRPGWAMPVVMARHGRAWLPLVLIGGARAAELAARARGGYVGGAGQGEEDAELTTWWGNGEVKKGRRHDDVCCRQGLQFGWRWPWMVPKASWEEEGGKVAENRMEIKPRRCSLELGSRRCSSGKIR
jgi:hypothetical protein